eukprot:941959-Pleurochrysis_carterae.AAC.1
MLACGVHQSANDYIAFSPIHDRSPCTKPLLNFEIGYPRLSTANMSRRLATYQPSAYLLVDCR